MHAKCETSFLLCSKVVTKAKVFATDLQTAQKLDVLEFHSKGIKYQIRVIS